MTAPLTPEEEAELPKTNLGRRLLASRSLVGTWTAESVERKPVTLHIGCDWPYGCSDYEEDTDPPRPR